LVWAIWDRLSTNILVTVAGRPAATFAMELRFTTPASAEVQSIARQAVARWERLFTGGLPAQRVDAVAGQCDPTRAIHETIQNLVVLIRVGRIDGAGGTLATAGTCVVRDGGVGNLLPAVASVTLDSTDLRRMLSQGQTALVQDLITHELGHALGIGMLWDIPNRTFVPGFFDPRADLHYTAPAAVRASGALGFATGSTVPVENDGELGTRGAHWRESVYGSEVMTPYLGARNPLSRITVAALGDLGYPVDESRADPFSPTIAWQPAVRADGSPAPTVRLEERILRPRFVRDRAGRLVALPPTAPEVP
jgi:hypothetical protein